MKVGQKIRGLRVEKGFTTSFMADKLGISEPTYRRYETDKSFPDIVMLDKISKILEKNFMDLLPNECFVQNNNSQKGGVVVKLDTINNLSEKLIEQFEKQLFEKDKLISEKDETIQELKAIITLNKSK
jgi:transcriptional regulator with XRE-family HTH domain